MDVDAVLLGVNPWSRKVLLLPVVFIVGCVLYININISAFHSPDGKICGQQ